MISNSYYEDQSRETLTCILLCYVENFASIDRWSATYRLELLTTKICVAENEDEFLYIRTVLEVFVLYSITTSDFAWICDSRAAYIGRPTENMSEITFSPSRVPSPLDASTSEGCLRLATLREKISRREHCRSEIIKKIIDLLNAMPLGLPFVTYDYDSQFHRHNTIRFVKKLKPTGYY